ncbi:hypothetical protein EDB87DRAFT_916491 [Lactarius vividus]|nr:hypothetical protein EDB87DRAFT_916491 [Lactarius vividus]
MGHETAPSVFNHCSAIRLAWTAFTENVTAAACDILGKRVHYREQPLRLRTLARLPPSCHKEWHLSVPCGLADQAVCSRPSLVQSCHRISQDHYSDSFWAGTHGVLQDFMSKSGIVTGFTPGHRQCDKGV